MRTTHSIHTYTYHTRQVMVLRTLMRVIYYRYMFSPLPNCRDFVQRYYGRPMSDANYQKLDSGANDQEWLSMPPDKPLIRGTAALLRRSNQAVYEVFQETRMRDLISDTFSAGLHRRNCEQVFPWHSSTKYAMKEVVQTPWVSKALVQQNPYMAQVVVNNTVVLNKRPRR